MNVIKFVTSYEKSAKALPALLNEWARIPSDLREHYVDELLFLFSRLEDAMEAAREQGAVELLQRLNHANAEFARLDLDGVLGISPEMPASKDATFARRAVVVDAVKWSNSAAFAA